MAVITLKVDVDAKTGKAELLGVAGALDKVGGSADKSKGRLSAYQASLSAAGSSMKSLGTTITLATAAAAAGIFLLVQSATNFESALAGVRKTVEGTDAEIQALGQEFRDMAKEIPISVTELLALGEAAGQLGVAREDIAEFARVAAEMGTATNLSADAAATGLAQLSNIMGTPKNEVRKLADALVALGNDGASTESQILEMGLRIALTGKQIGLTENQVLGFSAALANVGIDAEAGGNAISKTFSEMELAIARGGSALQNFQTVAALGGVKDFAETFKKDAAGAMLGFVKGLEQIQLSGGSVIGTLDALGISEIRQANAIKGLVSNVAGLERALSTAGAAQGALAKEFAAKNATMAAQFQLLKQRLADVGITVGSALQPAFASLIGAVNSAMPSLEQLGQTFLQNKAVFVEAANTIGSIGKAAFEAFAATVTTLIKAFASLPEPVRSVIVTVTALVAALGPLLLGLGAIASFAGTAVGGLASLAGGFGTATTAVTTAASAIGTALVGGLKNLGQVMTISKADFVSMGSSLKTWTVALLDGAKAAGVAVVGAVRNLGTSLAAGAAGLRTMATAAIANATAMGGQLLAGLKAAAVGMAGFAAAVVAVIAAFGAGWAIGTWIRDVTGLGKALDDLADKWSGLKDVEAAQGDFQKKIAGMQVGMAAARAAGTAGTPPNFVELPKTVVPPGAVQGLSTLTEAQKAAAEAAKQHAEAIQKLRDEATGADLSKQAADLSEALSGVDLQALSQNSALLDAQHQKVQTLIAGGLEQLPPALEAVEEAWYAANRAGKDGVDVFEEEAQAAIAANQALMDRAAREVEVAYDEQVDAVRAQHKEWERVKAELEAAKFTSQDLNDLFLGLAQLTGEMGMEGLSNGLQASVGLMEQFDQATKDGVLGWGELASLAAGTVAAFKEATDSASAMSRALGGAMVGASVGGKIGGIFGEQGKAIGAAIGAGVGAIAGIFRKPSWVKVGEEAGRVLGTEISKELAKTIEQTSKDLEISVSAASLLHITDAAAEAGKSMAEMAAPISDLMNGIAAGTVPAVEGMQQLEEVFGTVRDEAQGVGDAMTVAMLKAAEATGTLTEGMKSFISEQNQLMASGAAQIGEAIKNIGGDVHGAEMGTRAAQFFAVGFQQAIAEEGLVGAIDALGDQALEMFKGFKEKGNTAAATLLAPFANLEKVIGADTPAAKGMRANLELLQGMGKVFEGAFNQGLGTAELAQAFGAQLFDSFGALTAKGVDAKTAMTAIKPELDKSISAAQQLGVPLDANTAALKAQAEAMGFAFPTEPIVQLVDLMKTLVQGMGFQLPASTQAATSSIAGIGTTATTTLGQTQQSFDQLGTDAQQSFSQVGAQAQQSFGVIPGAAAAAAAGASSSLGTISSAAMATSSTVVSAFDGVGTQITTSMMQGTDQIAAQLVSAFGVGQTEALQLAAMIAQIGNQSITIPFKFQDQGGGPDFSGIGPLNLPMAAKGLKVEPRPGGTPVIMGEAGVREFAIPEPQLQRLMKGSDGAQAGPVSIQFSPTIVGSSDPIATARAVQQVFDNNIDGTVTKIRRSLAGRR